MRFGPGSTMPCTGSNCHFHLQFFFISEDLKLIGIVYDGWSENQTAFHQQSFSSAERSVFMSLWFSYSAFEKYYS